MEPGNLERRVNALESQVGELTGRVRASEQDAAAARVLAGAVDRDVAGFHSELRGVRGEVRGLRGEVGGLRGEVGDLRGDAGDLRGEFRDFRQATIGSFNALRADMTDLRTEMNGKFAQVDNGFIEMRGKLDAAAAGQQRIAELIQGLIDDRDDNGPAKS